MYIYAEHKEAFAVDIEFLFQKENTRKSVLPIKELVSYLKKG